MPELNTRRRWLMVLAAAATLVGAPMPSALAQGLVQGVQQGAREGSKAAGPVGGVLGGAIGGVVGVVGGVLGGVTGQNGRDAAGPVQPQTAPPAQTAQPAQAASPRSVREARKQARDAKAAAKAAQAKGAAAPAAAAPAALTAEQIVAGSDANIARIKSELKLTPEQEKHWGLFSSAMHYLGQHGAERLDLRKARAQRDPPDDIVEQMRNEAQFLYDRGADQRAVADAAEPLFATLDDKQKAIFVTEMVRLSTQRGLD